MADISIKPVSEAASKRSGKRASVRKWLFPKTAIQEEAQRYYWYHCVDLGRGIITDGDFDMREFWPAYQFPEVKGKSVLDVGRASGFFAFEFERLGAEVTATEIGTYLDWDFVGGEQERQARAKRFGDIAKFTEEQITGAFEFAHRVRRSAVRKVTSTIYDISPKKVGGEYDLVFAGSVTSHLRDPIRGLECFRSVTKPDGLCIVAAPFIGLDENLALSALVAGDVDRRSWWVVNRKGLVEMLKAAGFSRVEIVSDFNLKLRRQTELPDEFPHIVAHARP